MTKVKSISIEGSEPTPIVDKGIDEAQSRNTVANTDVVKVQDGNGVWHAIPFNKFIEVATPFVASIMNNLNLQGNIVKFLGLNANGAPGVSSLADAAAALGVTVSFGLSPNGISIDSLTTLGWYYITPENSPTGREGWLLVLHPTAILSIGKTIIQAYFPYSGESPLYRIKNWDNETWVGWKTFTLS